MATNTVLGRAKDGKSVGGQELFDCLVDNYKEASVVSTRVKSESENLVCLFSSPPPPS